MNEILILFLKVLVVLIPVLAGICALSLIWKNPLQEYADKKLILENKLNIGEVFITIDFIIKTECDLYEQYFENNTTADMITLTNSEFTNIYNSISMQCLKAVSPTLWELAEVYMTRDEVQTYITQKVMQFLLDKSTVTEDEEENSNDG